MVTTINGGPVSGHRLSSVVPAEVTGEHKDVQLTNVDLALKLHYIKGVYYFTSEAVEGLSYYDLKKPMFPLLALYYATAGRIRKSETGRPFVKCNDGGVRIVEAYCDKTIEEWLEGNDCDSKDDYLVYNQVLGPDLGFSPLVFIQLTQFKCGGLSVGLNWTHVLGDPISALTFLNNWAQFLQGHLSPKPLHMPTPKRLSNPPSNLNKPFSAKRVDPVGDYWLATHDCKMETHSFRLTQKQLHSILSNIESLTSPAKITHFEILSAIVWKSLSKIRGDSGPRMVTICASNSQENYENELLRNKMVFSIVRADFSVAKGDITELATLIANKKEEENSMIDETMKSDEGKSDYIVYGANLTFVNMEEANVYGLELIKGQKPIFANYTIHGVGDEGVVLVLPGSANGDGRTVTVILPENQLAELKNELGDDWAIALA